ncbi:hypothetical protein ACNKHT_08490 [Shigella flexneri]
MSMRATTLQFFIGKDTPAGNAAATQGAGGGNVNLSENAVGRLFTQLLRIERKTMVKVVGQHLALFARVSHISRACSGVMAGGFSHITWQPASSAIRVCS